MAFDKDLLQYYFVKAGFNERKIQWLEYNKCSPVFEGRDRGRWAGWSIYAEFEK
jgi:hypothetical protein